MKVKKMQRHYQVIFEAILSILIILEVFFLVMLSLGFLAGVKTSSVYGFGFYDVSIGILILLDFIVFRIKSDKNSNIMTFLKDNWAYLIAIIPIFFICFNLFQLFNYELIVGIVSIVRIIAILKVLQIISGQVLQYPKKTKLDYATIFLLVVLLVGSYIFFFVERGVNPTVPNYESALWYAIVSMTTTGYGDIVPRTLIGHILGVLFILSGMGYVSLVTATLAYSFIDLFRKESRNAMDNIGKTAEGLRDNFNDNGEKIDKVIEKLNDLEKKMEEMEKK
jgi:voltage-gated potassium channel